MCKTISCWKKIRVIDSQIAYVIHSILAILSTSSIPVIHVQIPKYFHMASFLGPSLHTPTKKWNQEHIKSHPNWLQFNQTHTKPKCYMVSHVPSKRVTHYKTPIGKTSFASHTKHTTKETQGSTSFMRDNI